MKKRFTEAQIVGFLRAADGGLPVKELCRKYGFSEASYYLWRSKFGGMTVSDAKRLKELEAENHRLKKLLAESLLENEVTRSGNWNCVFSPWRESRRCAPMIASSPRRSSNSRTRIRPASDVTRDP